jgi:hypothetical protein
MTEYSIRIVPGDAEAARAQFVDEHQVPVTLATPATEPGQPVTPAPENAAAAADD